MATSTITIDLWGEKSEMTADWKQAISPVLIDGSGQPMSGQQVADFSHRPEEAIRWYLRQLAIHSGDDPDDDDIAQEIEDIVDESLATEK